MKLMRVLFIACALLILTSGASSASDIYSGWPKQISAFIQEGRRLVRRGDLTDARNAILRAWVLYGSSHYTNITPKSLDEWSYTYLFPQGEAMRMFQIDWKSRLFYAEVRGDTFKVEWQAGLEYEITVRNAGKNACQLPFITTTGNGVVQSYGSPPAGNLALVYYQIDPILSLMSYGRITRSGAWVKGGSVFMNDLGLWRTVLIPWRLPTRHEVEAMTKAHKGLWPITGFGGEFLYARQGSRSGDIMWRAPWLPAIPGELPSGSQRLQGDRPRNGDTATPEGKGNDTVESDDPGPKRGGVDGSSSSGGTAYARSHAKTAKTDPTQKVTNQNITGFQEDVTVPSSWTLESHDDALSINLDLDNHAGAGVMYRSPNADWRYFVLANTSGISRAFEHQPRPCDIIHLKVVNNGNGTMTFSVNGYDVYPCICVTNLPAKTVIDEMDIMPSNEWIGYSPVTIEGPDVRSSNTLVRRDGKWLKW